MESAKIIPLHPYKQTYKQNLEYWKLPEVIQKDIEVHQVPFIRAFTDKIEQIKYYYSKPMTEAQQKFIAKDETLINETETFINYLDSRIQYLLREHETLNLMVNDLTERNRKLTDDLWEAHSEANRIRESYKKF